MMNVVFMCFFCTLAHVPSLILRYLPFRDEITKKQKQILIIIYTVALILNVALYFAAFQTGNINIAFYKYNLLLFCILMAVVNGLVITKRVRENFFTFGLTAITVFMFMTVSAFVESRLPITDIFTQITINAAVLCIMFVLFYPFLRKMMVNTITPFLSADSREYWKNIWFIPIAMFFASLLSFPMNQHIESPIQLVSRLLIGIATLFICRSMSYDYQQLQKREEMSRSLDRQKEYYEALSEKVEGARRTRHDFKHHISAIRAFVEKDDMEGLSQYCDELSKSDMSESFIPFTGNEAADGVIYHYSLLCKKEEISFKTEGMLRDVSIADIDLCVLLGNVLDNAFKACTDYDKDRFINLSFRQSDGVLTVSVQNSFDGILLKKDGVILSKKRENSTGIGLSSISGICQKYNGYMRIENDENIFSIMILLNSK